MTEKEQKNTKNDEKQETKENSCTNESKGCTLHDPANKCCGQHEPAKDNQIIEQYVNDLKRLQADFENYIKRSDKEKQELIEYGTHKLLSKLLHVVDEFETAVKFIEKTERKEDIASGVNMILKQLKKTLHEEGISEIASLGKEFDPYKHESIGHGKGEENKVVEEIKKGYMFKNKILRPSIVKIGHGGKQNE